MKNEWIELGPPDENGDWANALISDRLVEIMIHQGGEDTRVLALLHKEALNLACLLPEMKELLKVIRNVKMLELVPQLRKAIEPFEGKGVRDE